jgi:3-methyl-2-oxobutanoate hydroxymethyltransferase
MDEMIHHAKAVKRGCKTSLLVGKMPFMSYNVSPEKAVENAGRFIKEAGCDAVKIERGVAVKKTMKAIIDAGIPLMSHVGLTPQTFLMMGGFRVQGKDAESAKRIIEDALAIEEAGCFAVELECIPAKLAKIITEKVHIPTIGIGSGVFCDGQVLVTHDLLGMFERFQPRFAKKYVNLGELAVGAIGEFVKDIRKEKFPTQEHSFAMSKEELSKLLEKLKD